MSVLVIYKGEEKSEQSGILHPRKAGKMAVNGKREVVKTAIVVAVGAIAIFSVYGFVKLLAYYGQLPMP